MADLAVSRQTYHKASLFLDSVQSDSGAVYGYTDPGSKEATTAIGLALPHVSRLEEGQSRPAARRA